MTQQLFMQDLFDLEDLFQRNLGLYLLFSLKEKMKFEIVLQEENIKLEFSIILDNIKRIKDPKTNKINITYDYHFKVDNSQFTFMELYYYIYNKFLPFVIDYYPNFIEDSLFPQIFESIKNNIQIKKNLQTARVLDERNNLSQFQKLEDSFLPQYSEIGKGINFPLENETDRVELSETNNTFIKMLTNHFETNNKISYEFELDKSIFKKEPIELFELYYKQLICDDLFYHLKDQFEIFNLLCLDSPFNLEVKDVPSFNKSYFNQINMGRYLPFFAEDEWNNYMGLFRIFADTMRKQDFEIGDNYVHTPYTLSQPEYFNFNSFVSSEIQLFYRNQIGMNQKVLPYERFLENYIDVDLQDVDILISDINETVFDNLKTFPYLRFNGDSFGIITIGNLTSSAIGTLAVRFTIFNTTSKDTSSCIYYYEEQGLSNNDSNKLGRILNEMKAMMDNIFDFYPYHPSLFNRKNIYAELYTAKVLNISLKESKNKLDNELYAQEGYAKDLFLYGLILKNVKSKLKGALAIKNDLNEKSSFKYSMSDIKKRLAETIRDAYNEDLWLWILICLEKYLFVVSDLSMEASYSKDRYNHLNDFINDIEILLNSISGRKHKIILNKKDFTFQYKYKGENLNGLCYLTRYNLEKQTLEIFKLNCISVMKHEKLFLRTLIKEELEKKSEEKELMIVDFKIEKNFFKGIRILNIDEAFAEKVITMLKQQYNYFFELHLFPKMASRRAEIEERYKKVFEKKN